MVWLTQKQTLRRECKDWEDPQKLCRGADRYLSEWGPTVGSQGPLPLGTSGRLSRTCLRVTQLSGEGAGRPHSHQSLVRPLGEAGIPGHPGRLHFGTGGSEG